MGHGSKKELLVRALFLRRILLPDLAQLSADAHIAALGRRQLPDTECMHAIKRQVLAHLHLNAVPFIVTRLADYGHRHTRSSRNLACFGSSAGGLGTSSTAGS